MNEEDVIADIKINMTDKKIRRYSENGRRSVRRPEEILRDVRGLKLRQRVSLVLHDEILREELEHSIKNFKINGVSNLNSFRTYQDFLLPILQPSLISNSSNKGLRLPINDIRGENTVKYNKVEKHLRCKLASVYRLVDIFGWSQAIYNHISVRVGDNDEYLLNPFGLLFSEVTASSLIKCNLNGDFIDKGTTKLGVNKAGFILHSTIHEARPDIKCIIHVHTPSVVAVSSMKCGFLRLSQESLIVGGVSYHDYCGILIDDVEKSSIKEDLGSKNMVMFLRNHGVVVCGSTIEKALHLLEPLLIACEIQVKAIPIGIDNLNIISDDAYAQVQEAISNGGRSVKHEGEGNLSIDILYFEAWMRYLDSQGYRTGYIYNLPDIFVGEKSTTKVPEAQIPPQATSDREMPYHIYYDYHQSKARNPSLGVGNTYRNKMKWLNSSPVQATQYNKEPIQTIEQPNFKDDPIEQVNGLSADDENDHNESVNSEKNDGESPNGHNDVSLNGINVSSHVNEITEEKHKVTKTETTTVTKTTKVVKNVEDKLVVNAEGLTLERSVSDLESNGNDSTVGNDAVSSSEPSGNQLKSPHKVKKQKSFKKALLKKLHKKEDKQK